MKIKMTIQIEDRGLHEVETEIEETILELAKVPMRETLMAKIIPMASDLIVDVIREVAGEVEKRPEDAERRVYQDLFDGWNDGPSVESYNSNAVVNGFDAHTKSKVPVSEPQYVFAVYDTEGYEGSALVMWSEDGENINVVEASHCSCFGLEEGGLDRFTTHSRKDIKRMAKADYGLFSDYADEIKKWLRIMKADMNLNLITKVDFDD